MDTGSISKSAGKKICRCLLGHSNPTWNLVWPGRPALQLGRAVSIHLRSVSILGFFTGMYAFSNACSTLGHNSYRNCDRFLLLRLPIIIAEVLVATTCCTLNSWVGIFWTIFYMLVLFIIFILHFDCRYHIYDDMSWSDNCLDLNLGDQILMF